MPKLKLTEQNQFNSIEKGPIYRSLFSNGACYNFHYAQGFSGARANITFIAGSMFENSDEAGIAHLIEHLLFKEVKSDRISTLENGGAQLNAFTYKESVTIEMNCHTEDIVELFPLFLDQFLYLDFDKEQFKKEKKIICHELKEDKDDHEASGIEELFEKNFNYAIGHPVGGKVSKVKDYSEENILSYYKKYFTADRLIISVVSGKEVDLFEITEKKISERFDTKSKPPFRLLAGNKKEKLKHFKKKSKKKMESSISFFGFNGPKINDLHYYDYLVLDELLFDGISSLLFKAMREQNALVYGMVSSLNSFHNCGQYMMIFSGSAKKEKAIKEVLFENLRKIANAEVSLDHIDAIKMKMVQSWELSFDSLDERIEFLTDQEIYGLHAKTLSKMKEELFKVTSLSIQKLAKKLYKNEDYSYLLYQNKG